MKVTVVSKELIVPSSATPFDRKTYKLSCIDQLIPHCYIPLILYFSYHESTQSIMTIKLKSSLSKTLTPFYPFAGRLTKDQNTIDCTDQGVPFMVARIGSNLLEVITSPVIEDLNQLVMLGPSYVEEQMAIQVNFFDCGGIAIGLSISHRIADACSFSLFLRHWFEMVKGSEGLLIGPTLDSAVLFPPTDSLHQFSRNPKDLRFRVPMEKLVTKRFVFSSLAINKLKHEVVKNNTTLVNPTRVEIVTALIWKCATDMLGDCKASVAFHIVNFRQKMVPPLQDQQFGNLFQMTSAIAHQTRDLASLVAKLRCSFGKIDSEYMKSLLGENGAGIAKSNITEIRKFMREEGVRVLRFSSWCRFDFDKCDFGWGRPVWISSAHFNDENCIILMDSRLDDGIEAWVVMNQDNMKKFEENPELQSSVHPATS